MANIILGGGVAGLIWALYNKGIIITKDIGGQFASDFNLGARIVDDTEYTRKLLNDLDIKFMEKTVRVGFCSEGNDFCDQTEEFRKEYYCFSRGIKTENIDKTCMNGNKSFLRCLDFDLPELTKKLQEKLKERIVVDEIKKIDLEKKQVFTNKCIFCYETLINTLPFDFFASVSNLLFNSERNSVTFVKLKKGFFKFITYDFVYFINKPFNRMTCFDDYDVAEIPGEMEEANLKEIFGDFYIKFKVLKTQLISGESPPEIKDVKLFGRYGSWNREYKINKLAEEAIKNGQKNNLG